MLLLWLSFWGVLPVQAIIVKVVNAKNIASHRDNLETNKIWNGPNWRNIAGRNVILDRVVQYILERAQ